MALDLNIDKKLNFTGTEHGEKPEHMPAQTRAIFQFISAEEGVSKENKNNTYLKLVAQVIEGEYKGRNVFLILNLGSTNKTATEIAAKELAAIKRALNMPNLRDKQQLLNVPFIGTVGVKPGQGQYGPSNFFTKYEPRSAGLKPVANPQQASNANSVPASSVPDDMPEPDFMNQ